MKTLSNLLPLALAPFVSGLLDVSDARAEKFPSGPVRFITSIAAGSGTDPVMRIVVEHLGQLWGQQTVLVNQPGAGGALAARSALTAAPDGRTLHMAIAS